MPPHSRRSGPIFALLALSAWGLLPIYWKQLTTVPSLEVIAHRVVWSVLFLVGFCLARGTYRELLSVAKSPKKLGTLVVTGTLIASNWLVYVWGVNHGRLTEASLGYFLSPLLTIALGALVLNEQLSPHKKVAVALAALGVLLKAVSSGTVPWIGLCLAFSMSLYGFFRKQCEVSALAGLTVETAMLAPVAVAYLSYLSTMGESHLVSEGSLTTLLLVLTGVATSLPLIWFVRASKELPLSTLGILQYLAPTLQLLLAVLVYDEPMSASTYTSFTLIWLAIGVYLSADLFKRREQFSEAA